MGKNFEIIYAFLKETKKPYCDDCISDITKVKPRQQVFQICRENRDVIKENPVGQCAKCMKYKKTRGV